MGLIQWIKCSKFEVVNNHLLTSHFIIRTNLVWQVSNQANTAPSFCSALLFVSQGLPPPAATQESEEVSEGRSVRSSVTRMGVWSWEEIGTTKRQLKS